MAASKDIAPKNQPRQGTRQESFESRGKRGSTGSLAQTRAAIYGNPLPLYVSQNEQLSLLWSLTWALSLSCQVLAAQLKSSTKSRNRVSREAYLEEKIQGYWDEHTKSVWVLPARQTASKRRRRKSAIPTSATSNSDDYADASTSHIKDEDKTTTWMDSLWKRGFFGKGSLSRSEPTWWQREKNRVTGEHGGSPLTSKSSLLYPSTRTN